MSYIPFPLLLRIKGEWIYFPLLYSVRALWHYPIQYNIEVFRGFSLSPFTSELKVNQCLEAQPWGKSCSREGGAEKRQEAWGLRGGCHRGATAPALNQPCLMWERKPPDQDSVTRSRTKTKLAHIFPPTSCVNWESYVTAVTPFSCR